MIMDWMDKTLVEVRDALAAGAVSAGDLVRGYLGRIEKRNPRINAYHEVWTQRALAQAAAVDQGAFRGRPLAGVPLAIKDNLCTQVGATTCGSRMLEHFHAPYTATAVQKLEEAGAIILGKTNLDEFAMGSSNENCAWGPVKNPCDETRVPGGSSGGSAAAVAAGMCAGALGSDTGGSIRLPAAWCGVVGLKPSYGRVSRYGLVAFASSLDQIGVFGRCVDDAALLLGVIAGPDPLDSTCAPRPVPDYRAAAHESPQGLKIGVAREYLSPANDPAVQRMMETALARFRAAGVAVVEVSLPHTPYGISTYYIVCTAEASSNLARYDGVRYGYRSAAAQDLIQVYSRTRQEAFGPEVKRRIMLGTYVLSSGYYDAYYLKALRVRRLIKEDFDRAFGQCDAIVCPTSTGPAFKLGDQSDDPLKMYLNDVYTVNCNLAGIPGISLPGATVEVEGCQLPLGLQLLGPVFEEAKLLRLARVYEGGQ